MGAEIHMSGWVQTAITTILLGVLGYFMRAWKQEVKEEAAQHRTQVDKDIREVRDDFNNELGHTNKDLKRAHIRITQSLDEREQLKQIYLREDTHDLKCENSCLKIQNHVSGEMKKISDQFFKELRELKKCVNAIQVRNTELDKRTNFLSDTQRPIK